MVGKRSPSGCEPAQSNRSGFSGFQKPNYTPVPDELFDVLLPELSGSQLKVLLYVIRRTFGFKKRVDRISKSQLESGIHRQNGDVLDRGTGLSRRAIRSAISSLVAMGILTKTTRFSSKSGHQTTEYGLHVIGNDPWVPSTQGRGKKVPEPLGTSCPIQQTVSQESEFHPLVQHSRRDRNCERPDDECQFLAEYLYAAILRNTPDARLPQSLDEWAISFRLMRDSDRRRPEDIRAVIDWATANSFWRPNILSAAKLREKFDTLKGQMDRANHSSSPSQATGENGFVC